MLKIGIRSVPKHSDESNIAVHLGRDAFWMFALGWRDWSAGGRGCNQAETGPSLWHRPKTGHLDTSVLFATEISVNSCCSCWFMIWVVSQDVPRYLRIRCHSQVMYCPFACCRAIGNSEIKEIHRSNLILFVPEPSHIFGRPIFWPTSLGAGFRVRFSWTFSLAWWSWPTE